MRFGLLRRSKTLPLSTLPFLTTLLLAACGGDNGTDVPTAPSGSRLVFSSQPHDVLDRYTFTGPLRVQLVDASGTPIPGHLEGVTLSVQTEGAGWYLDGTTEIPLTEGEAVFANLSARLTSQPTGTVTVLNARIRAEWRDLQVLSDEFSIVTDPDFLRLDPFVPAGGGYLLDGFAEGEDFNDTPAPWEPLSNTYTVIRASAVNNEVLVFARGFAPNILAANWTPGVDTIDVTLRDPVIVPVVIRVASQTLTDAEQTVLAAVDAANDIFYEEAMGVRLQAQVVDATSHALADQFQTVADDTPSQVGVDALGYTSGSLNVYAVGSIEGANGPPPVLGRATVGGDLSMIADGGWDGRTLAHLIGHNFSLEHTDGVFTNRQSNLMLENAVTPGTTLTEGQTFRAHFRSTSALVTSLGITPPAFVRPCLEQEATTLCPRLITGLVAPSPGN